MTSYIIGDELISSEDAQFQSRLADAHQRRVRPLCTCRDQGHQLAMAIAHLQIKGADRYIIRRLPETGHDHAADCHHHEEPEGLSGLTQVRGTAIQHDEDDDTYKLKLDFPLGQNDRRPPIIDPDTAHGASKPRPKDSRLKPIGLLHHLWHGADLTRMNGGILHHRSWNVVRARLLTFLTRQRTSTRDIAKLAFIPQTFNLDDKTRLEGAMRARLNQAMDQKQALILIGEVKDIQDRQLVIKHLPFARLMIGETARASLARAWSRAEPLRMALEHSHIIAIAIIFVAPTGLALIHDIDLMNVTAQWVPFETMDEHDLLAGFDQARRTYQKSLSYGTPAPISFARLLDTGDHGTACFVVRGAISADLQAVMDALSADHLPLWCWQSDESRPDLPGKSRANKDAIPEP